METVLLVEWKDIVGERVRQRGRHEEVSHGCRPPQLPIWMHNRRSYFQILPLLSERYNICPDKHV